MATLGRGNGLRLSNRNGLSIAPKPTVVLEAEREGVSLPWGEPVPGPSGQDGEDGEDGEDGADGRDGLILVDGQPRTVSLVSNGDGTHRMVVTVDD